MHGKLAHFAIEADDVERARAFYETVFGWSFEPWGPPEFYLIHGARVHGALQRRYQQAWKGLGPVQLSFAVENAEDAIAAIEKAGGTVRDDRHKVPGVGRIVSFADTEGNEAMIVEYEPDAAERIGIA